MQAKKKRRKASSGIILESDTLTEDEAEESSDVDFEDGDFETLKQKCTRNQKIKNVQEPLNSEIPKRGRGRPCKKPKVFKEDFKEPEILNPELDEDEFENHQNFENHDFTLV